MPITLEKPVGKGALIFGAHPLGMKAVADRSIWSAQRELPHPIAGAQGKTALIIGSTSPGYGSATALALRAAGFGKIIGIGYERPPTLDKNFRASPGWYLTRHLHEAGIIDRTYFADAFADDTRRRVMRDMVANDERIDLMVYSLAAGTRSYGTQKWNSSLKVIGESLDVTALDYNMLDYKGVKLKPARIEAATEEQIAHTVKVMGGEDLSFWVGALFMSGRLNPGAFITSRSYIGPEGLLDLRRIYRDGSIGASKKDNERVTREWDARLRDIDVRALAEVDPAVVTIASAQIPAIAKYLAAYLGVADGGAKIYRDPIGVSVDLVRALYGQGEPWKNLLDDEGRLRLDGHEMQEALQASILEQWNANNQPGEPTETLKEGLDRYRENYLGLFGFGLPEVDYSKPFELDTTLAGGIVDLLSEPMPTPIVIPAAREPQPEITSAPEVKVTAVGAFFDALLSRDNEPGVMAQSEGDKKVFVSQYSLNPSTIRRYVAATQQPQDGNVPSAFTFVMAFPNILDAIKDVLRTAAIKSVVHAAEEVTMLAPIPADGSVTVRAWLAKKVGKGPVVTIVQRELVGSDGTLLATGKTTLAVGGDLSALPAVLAKPEDSAGELLSRIHVDQSLIDIYSKASEDTNPIHISEEAAKALGLSSTIAHGMLTLGLANRDNPSNYTAKWKTPVQAGDTVEFRRMDDNKIVGVIARGGQMFLAIELTKKSS